MKKRSARAPALLLAATLVTATALVASTDTQAGPTPAPANAYAYIGYPNDGQTLPAGKPFKVWFGLRFMGVAPRGVKFPNTGHHHLLIDVDLPPMDQEIPSDRNHLHYGAGETETLIELPPGKHTLQLLMGDDKHIPHNPPVYSRKITIYVR
ncbi:MULTISPECIES: DUF4399 domain-containing protein [unclassified Caballeronia]|uniref:DUF4399 domain-containing protein n=1 Tax=unclassified Caballeronia TaxID=2646786 RepID=UPI00286371B4|nr:MULTISPECIES: DUF4399 domain-containing protein [unclassified Caballeronia]MDR5824955.1 DUF4399 domain-containing protein [Caballeronia sp. LZ043]MDR5882836.1 DUF4399 domain-containing protein [Caballeronia sp. LZ032]